MEEISGFIEISNPVGIQRGLQGQDGIETDNNCYIAGDFNICPAGADFEFDGATKRLTADLKCPLNAVAQSDFRQASQEGRCQCDATIRDAIESADAAEPLNCECFICPSSANQFGVAYYCTTPIAGSCLSFNCNGDCNGDPDLNFIENFSEAPTAAPQGGGGGGDSAMGTHPAIASTALVLLTLARMLR